MDKINFDITNLNHNQITILKFILDCVQVIRRYENSGLPQGINSVEYEIELKYSRINDLIKVPENLPFLKFIRIDAVLKKFESLRSKLVVKCNKCGESRWNPGINYMVKDNLCSKCEEKERI